MTTTALDARSAAVLAGLSRGWIETRQQFTETATVIGHLIPPVVYVAVLLSMRGKTVPGTDFALAAMVLPGVLGFSIAFGGLSGPATAIATEREDGTLLRAKAVPHGMLGYLVGKIVTFALTTLVGLIAILVPGLLVTGDLNLDARAWLLLALIFVVGMVSTVPIGACTRLPREVDCAEPAGAPRVRAARHSVRHLHADHRACRRGLQWVGQAFPIYWVGLGARSAMLPAEMAVVEIGDSWRTVEMFAVLGVWSACRSAARTDPAAPHGPASVGIHGGRGAGAHHGQGLLTRGGIRRRRPQPHRDAARRTRRLTARAG